MSWLTDMLEMRTAHADSRKFVIEHIHGQSKELLKHLLLLFYFPKNQCVNHWKNEINTWLKDLSLYTLKPKNKKVPLDMYKDNLFDPYAEDESEFLWKGKILFKEVCKEENLTPVSLTHECWEAFKIFRDKTLQELVKKSESDFIEIIEEFISKGLKDI